MNIRLYPEARQELQSAVAYYEQAGTELGADFTAELKARLERIGENPRMYPVVTAPGIRRALLNRFPYSILFVETGDAIEVIAIAHHSRREYYWLDRL